MEGGLKEIVSLIWQNGIHVAHDTPATHAAGAYNAFAITGGPVWIRAIVEYNDTLIAGATTTRITVGAVAMDVGAVSIAGAAGTLVVSPLDAAVAKIAAALAVQMPSLLGFATNIGVVASPGVNITVTFAGVAMGALENTSYYVVYQKLSPQSLIQ
jgi:hypothetical protein